MVLNGFYETSVKELMSATSFFLILYGLHYITRYGNLVSSFYVYFISTFTLMATHADRLGDE